MSLSGISSFSTAPTNNTRAEFERLRHAQGLQDVVSKKHQISRDEDGHKPSTAASALAGASPDPNAAQAAGAGGRVNITA